MKKDNLEVILEDIRIKFNLVLEGHDAIRKEMQNMHDDLKSQIEHNTLIINVVNQKVDKLEFKVDNIEVKVDKLEVKGDGIISDLKAHRSDTESHHGLYLVKEG